MRAARAVVARRGTIEAVQGAAERASSRGSFAGVAAEGGKPLARFERIAAIATATTRMEPGAGAKAARQYRP